MQNKQRKSKFPSKLLAQVKQNDLERFKADYTEYNFVLEVVREAILCDIKALESTEESAELFGNPNWAEHQAFLIGQRKGLKATLKYLNINKGEG